MNEIFERAALLLGEENINILSGKKVAVFGIGGVGSYTVESLVRTGIGSLILVDGDIVCKSNINRQLVAEIGTIGMKKTDVAKARALAVNPDIKVFCVDLFFLPDDDSSFLADCDYVVDAIDTVSSKLYLAEICHNLNIPIISAMSAGNKTDPCMFEISDIKNTSVCPLCRVMRRELKSRGINSLKVVYSKEQPKTPPKTDSRKQTPGSLSFVTGVAGFIIAKQVIFDLLEI